MKKIFLLTGILSGLFMMGVLSSCSKNNPAEPLEPISLVSPDSTVSQHFAGDSVGIQLKFTTDRPINWVQILYAVDTTGKANNTPSLYPDTLFYRLTANDTPRTNLYTYTGFYRIADTLPDFSVIYFDASFQAGNSSFTVGQNYPAGIVTGDKKFKIVIL